MQRNNRDPESIVISKTKYNRKWNRNIQSNSDSESEDRKKLRRHNSQHTRHKRMEETEAQRERYRELLGVLDLRYKLLRNKYGDTILKNNPMMEFILHCKNEKIFYQYAVNLNQSERDVLWHYIKLYHYFFETFHRHINYAVDKAHTMSVPKMKEHIRALRTYIEFAQQYYKEASLLECAKIENEHLSVPDDIWDDWDCGDLNNLTVNEDTQKICSRLKSLVFPQLEMTEIKKEKAFFSLVNTKLLQFHRDSINLSSQKKEESTEIEGDSEVKTILFQRSNHIKEEDLPPIAYLRKDCNADILDDRDEVEDIPSVADLVKANDLLKDEFKEAEMITELRNALNVFAENASYKHKTPTLLSIHRALNLFEKEKSKNQDLKTSQTGIPTLKTISFFGSKDNEDVVPDKVRLYKLTRRKTIG